MIFKRLLVRFSSCRILLFFLFVSLLESQPADQARGAASGSGSSSLMITDSYVHNWVSLPPLSGYGLNGESIRQETTRGFAYIVIFIASYCIPCQQLTRHLLDLEKKYAGLNVRFIWVFSHDFRKDAIGFAKQYGIKQALVADEQTLKHWKNPRLPGVFLGDRYGWLLAMFPSANPQAIREIDQILSNIAIY